MTPERPPITGHTRTLAVLGRPVRHSLSPYLHNRWLSAAGIDARYVALDVPPEQAHQVATALRTLGLAGANLTVPIKEAVLPHLDRLAPSVQRAGAVNTVTVEDGVLVGHNTDGAGFVAHARWRDTDLSRPAIVLGAGGAGRAVAAALIDAGVPQVALLNRTPDRAHAVAAALGDSALLPGPLTDFPRHAPDAGLVVVAVSGGGHASISSLDPTLLPVGATWADLNYWQAQPPLREEAQAHGLIFDDGWGMLVAQAVEALRLFVGLSLSLDAAHAQAPRP